jgi:hypothetical protein
VPPPGKKLMKVMSLRALKKTMYFKNVLQTEHGNIKYVKNMVRKFVPTTFPVSALLLVKLLTT